MCPKHGVNVNNSTSGLERTTGIGEGTWRYREVGLVAALHSRTAQTDSVPVNRGKVE
jgi:hypothetical protein